MPKTKFIVPLCEIIKDSDTNMNSTFDKLNEISILINSANIEDNQKKNIYSKLEDAMNSLQYQDLHKQKIERVINNLCEAHSIDPKEFNIASSAKTIDSTNKENVIDEDELENLIKKMG